MNRAGPLIAVTVLGGALTVGCDRERQVGFQADVMPILKQQCVDCHSPPEGQGYVESGLSMESYETLMKGTKFGPIINPGSPIDSTLIRLVEGKADPSIRMPHGGAELSEREQETLRLWVKQGARND